MRQLIHDLFSVAIELNLKLTLKKTNTLQNIFTHFLQKLCIKEAKLMVQIHLSRIEEPPETVKMPFYD